MRTRSGTWAKSETIRNFRDQYILREQIDMAFQRATFPRQ
jgi:hypothetical protein